MDPKPFRVESGAICFGAPHNVQWGAQQPIEQPQQQPELVCDGGTVFKSSFEFNIAALNGRWKAYPLVYANSNSNINSIGESKDETPAIVGWFAVHESLDEDPYAEACRIVEVANSPYEDDDNGANRNTKETWNGRVLVVNRYDWGYHDRRGYDNDSVDDNETMNAAALRTEIFLVDYGHATKHQEEAPTNSNVWIATSEEGGADDGQEQHLPLGVSMVLTNAEYIFARFGLTHTREAVHSFLYFTGQTDLSRTVFFSFDESELPRPIYVKLPPEQRHAKRLRLAADGDVETYTGFPYLRTHVLANKHNTRHDSSVITVRSLLGPFGVQLLPMDQLVLMQQEKCPDSCPFEPALLNDISQLLNECICFFVIQLANNATTTRSTAAATDSSGDVVASNSTVVTRDDWLNCTLPQRNANGSVDSFVFECLEKGEEESICLDQEGLNQLVSNDHVVWNYMMTKGLAGAVRFLLGEVLELASNVARGDHQRNVIVPSDLRMAILHDEELYNKLGKNKAFYPPDMWED